MFFAKILFIALMCCFTVSQGGIIKISVYYETLCPDSVRFIETQLYPNVEVFHEYILLDLIPFGKATATDHNGRWSFVCQHGPNECYGNKLHSCAISLSPIRNSAKFVYCSMGKDNPASTANLKQCSAQADISWKTLNDCYTSGKADKLLALNGKRTHEVFPPVTFIPTVVFNDRYDDNLQQAALKDLKSVICQLLNNEHPACYQNLEYYGVQVIEV